MMAAVVGGLVILVILATGWLLWPREPSSQITSPDAQPGMGDQAAAPAIDPGGVAQPGDQGGLSPAGTPAPETAPPAPATPAAGPSTMTPPGETAARSSGAAASTPRAAAKGSAPAPAPVAPQPTPLATPAVPLELPPPASVEEPSASVPAIPAAEEIFKGVRMARRNGPEVGVEIQFGPEQMFVKNIGGRQTFHSLHYSAIRDAAYLESRHSRVFVRTTRHWLVLRGQEGWELRLRLERDDAKDIVSAFEKRWGHPVKVLTPEQDPEER
jgi:hypothetical protein